MKYFALLLVCASCAANGPQPGSLNYVMQQQQRQLARDCERSLTSGPWKDTYYNVRGVLVDERTYCKVLAGALINARHGPGNDH